MGWGGAQQPDEEVCFFQAGGMVLGLWTALGGHGAPGIELAQNVRAPEEVAVVLAEAEQAGGKIVRPAARADWGVIRVTQVELEELRKAGFPDQESLEYVGF